MLSNCNYGKDNILNYLSPDDIKNISRNDPAFAKKVKNNDNLYNYYRDYDSKISVPEIEVPSKFVDFYKIQV